MVDYKYAEIPSKTKRDFKSGDGCYYARVTWGYNKYKSFEIYRSSDCSYEDALSVVLKKLGYSEKKKPGKNVQIKLRSQQKHKI